MGMDQQINYRVNIDDSNFQAKLTQMRASMDQTMMGGGMGGGMGGMNGAAFMSNMGSMMGVGGGGGGFGGIAPVSYSPPGIATTPHFGMLQVQQTFASQAMHSVGMASLNPFSSATTPNNITPNELGQISARGMGNRVADGASSGILGTLSAVVGGVTGSIGGAIGGFLTGGPVGAFAGAIGGGAVGSAVVGKIADKVAENRAIQTDLERSTQRLIVGGPDADQETGRGLSRKARVRAAEDLQYLGASDSRFTTEDFRKIQNMGIDSGLFRGKVTDTNSLNEETKKLASSIKLITETLHTSIEEAGQVVQNLKRIGVTDDKDVKKMTLQSELLGRMSGITGKEMGAIGQAGGEFFRGTGVKMQLGKETAEQNRFMIGEMRKQGLLSDDDIQQAGGEEAYTQKVLGAQLATAQSPIGQAVMAANYSKKTGKVDWAGVRKMMTSQTEEQILRKGGAALQDTELAFSFSHNQEKVIGDAGAAGLQALVDDANTLAGQSLKKGINANIKDEDAADVAARGAGMDFSQRKYLEASRKLDRNRIKQVAEEQVTSLEKDRFSQEVKDASTGKALYGNFAEQLALSQSNPIAEATGNVGESVEKGLNRLRTKKDILIAKGMGRDIPSSVQDMANGIPIEKASRVIDGGVSTIPSAGEGTNAPSGPSGSSRSASAAPAGPSAAAAVSNVMDAQKHIDSMSRQLMNNYQVLINMQKELDGLMRSSK